VSFSFWVTDWRREEDTPAGRDRERGGGFLEEEDVYGFEGRFFEKIFEDGEALVDVVQDDVDAHLRVFTSRGRRAGRFWLGAGAVLMSSSSSLLAAEAVFFRLAS
jgi:hypothetical protein